MSSVYGLLLNATDTGADWLETFKPFTLYHAVCVAACLAIMLGVALLGLHSRGTPRAHRMRIEVAIVGLLYWIGSNTWWCWPSNFDLQDSLPLHICDLAGLLGPLALLTRKRWLLAILYFWGFALSSQGFFQPVLTVGAAHTRFWLFWANHTVIVGTALYAVVALGFRPRLRDWLISCAALVVVFVLVLPFDILCHVDYCYIGDDHARTPPFIRSLGPWPWRLLLMFLITFATTALIWLPWALVKHRDHATRSSEADPATTRSS